MPPDRLPAASTGSPPSVRWQALTAIAFSACSGALAPLDAGTDAGHDAGRSMDAGTHEIVAAHNAVRARAMPAPSPALPPMTWSETAAATAQSWVEQCRFLHNPALSGDLGENIFASSGLKVTPTDVVESWASEASNYDYTNNRCTQVCGHYTQIVWRASLGVGCAFKQCTGNSPFGTRDPWLFWVCDYAPAGNIVGRRPY